MYTWIEYRAGPVHRIAGRTWGLPLESQSKVQAERDGVSRDPDGWPIEADWHHRLHEVSLEEALFDRPTMVHQGRESPHRSIDVKGCPHADAEVTPHGPYQSRMYGKGAPARRVLHSRHQFQVVCYAPFSLEGNAKRKADGKVIRQVRGRASCMCDQRKHKTDMSTQVCLRVCRRNIRHQEHSHRKPKRN